jgi:hypothetical protein
LGKNQRSLVGNPLLLFMAASVEAAMSYIPQKAGPAPL